MNKKHKAFIGAAVNAAMSIATGLINGNKAKKQALRNARISNWNNAYQQATELEDYMNNNQDMSDRFQNQIQLRCGGRKRKKCGGKSKAGLGIDLKAEGMEALDTGIGAIGQLASTFINRDQQLRCGGKRKMRGGGISSRHQGTGTSFANSRIGRYLKEFVTPTNNNEQGGSFGGGHTGGGGAGAQAGYKTKVVTDTIPGDTIVIPIQQTFNDAFKNARERGDSSFEFNGKQYSTELGDNPDNWEVGQKRKRVTLMPIVRDTTYRDRFVTERTW